MSNSQYQPAKKQYYAIKELTAINMGEEWFYVNSHLLNPDKYEFKYANELPKGTEIELLELTLNEIARKAKDRQDLLQRALEEIDYGVTHTPEDDAAYDQLVTWDMGMTNLPFKTWQEYKDFLLRFKQKLKQCITSSI